MIQRVKTQHKATHPQRSHAVGLALLASVIGITSVMGGCRGDRSDNPPRRFFPDMDYQPKVKPQSDYAFFENGSSARLPVEGTVSFGDHSVIGDNHSYWSHMFEKDRADRLKADETYYFGLVAGSTTDEPQYVAKMPLEVSEEMIDRGAQRYNIYCAMCHGFDGLGNDSGTVGRLMNVRPINLLDDKYRDRSTEFGSDGYIFHIIRDGLWSPDGSNRMPAYGHAVDEQDAWSIVAYIRTLQAAFDAEGKSISQAHELAPQTVTDSSSEQQIMNDDQNPSNGGEG